VGRTPGADDNASGSALNLLLKEKLPPTQHTIIYAFFDAEESGLVGSQAFATKMLATKTLKCDFMLNLDMVSRFRPRAPAAVADPMPVLFAKYPWARDVTFRVSGPSDHAPFARLGIPVVWIFTGDHSDYHTLSDTPDKVNYQGIEQIADYLVDLIVAFDKEVDTKFIESLNDKRCKP
jgi:Zn-dependent M28 family amino/carboxypeptidase